jgi:hypothetical protein
MLSFTFYPRTSWTPNRFGAFGELRGLPYNCSTAGQHTHRWARVYEAGNYAPKLVVDQLGHSLDVSQNVYTQSPVESRLAAVNQLGRVHTIKTKSW